MKILLHICCATCAILPVRIMREANQSVTGFFHNPNVHPYTEFRKRIESVSDYAKASELEVFFDEDYGLEDFLAQVAQDPAGRCSFCYETRLRTTAEFAAANGFDAFSTSLLASPYQDHAVIRAFGQEFADLFEISFLYQDFRVAWKKRLETSRAMNLYQQTYCGCIYSEKESFFPFKPN